jgi:hypothetical protein
MSLLLAAVAAFELQLPIMCGPTDNLLAGLRERFQEQIIFMSPSKNEIDEDLTHTFWLNPDTQTWSFVVTNKQKQTTCILASGNKFQLFPPQGTET